MISLFSFDDDGLSTLCWFLIIGVVYDDSVLSVIDEVVHRPPSEDEPSRKHFCSLSQLTIKIPISDVSLSSSSDLATHDLLLSVSMAVAISDVSNVLHSLLLWCTSCVTTSWVCCCVAITLFLTADVRVVALTASKVTVAVDLVVVDIVLN